MTSSILRGLAACLSLALVAAPFAEAQPITPEELAEQWSFYGKGTRAAQNRMFYMEESPGSSGVMIFSPRPYSGDVTIRYEVMPMNPASICVALLAASDIGEADSLTLPPAATEGSGPGLSDMDAYFFAFHNQAHNRKPFILKYPAGTNLIEKDKNVVRSGQFHQVELSRRGKLLSLTIDGNLVIQVEDPDPLQSGHIGFRIRGIPQVPAACLIRNVSIDSPGK